MHSIHSYILTYYRLRKWEPVIALCSRQISASAVTHYGEEGVGGAYLNTLVEVVPNCLVAFYDTRSESSNEFYYPIPAGRTLRRICVCSFFSGEDDHLHRHQWTGLCGFMTWLMRPIIARKVLEQWGQDNAAGRAGAVETLLVRAFRTSRLFWRPRCGAARKLKGNRQACDNHRGMSLLSIAGKVLARILTTDLLCHCVIFVKVNLKKKYM